jgi:hypothetical protein
MLLISRHPRHPHLPAFPLLVLLLLFSECFHPSAASGGVSVFVQNAELLPLAFCLTLLVFLTISFEIALHNFKHHVEHTWTRTKRAMLIVIQKVTGELTVLGFISALVLVTANSELMQNESIQSYLPELEVAHMWLFFVGMMYVFESLYLLRVKNAAFSHYTRGEKAENKAIVYQKDGTKQLKNKRSNCCSIICGCESDRYFYSTHKMYRILFKHFHRIPIHSKLGHVDLFDYSSYLECFWEHLITSSMEISVASWCGFLIIFWLVIVYRYLTSLSNDTELVTTAIVGNWLLYICFQILTWEQKYSMYKMDKYIAKVVTGGKNNETLEDAIDVLYTICDAKDTFDDDGMDWLKHDQNHNGIFDSQEKKTDVEAAGGAPPPSTVPTPTQTFYNGMNKFQVRANILRIKKQDLRKQTLCSVNHKRVLFSVLVFIHSFMYGWFVFLNIREVENITKYYGRTTSMAEGSNSTSSTSSTSSSGGSSSHRMLLSLDVLDATGRRRSLSSTSSSTGSDHGPSADTDGWYTCSEYRDAGTERAPDSLASPEFASMGRFIYLSGYNNHLPHSCTVHNTLEMFVYLIFNTLLPLVYTTVFLIPRYLFSFAYQKSLIGSSSHDKHHVSRLGMTRSGNSRSNRVSPENVNVDDFMKEDEDDTDKTMAGHGEHGGGHGHGSWCQNTLFGHDSTTFDILVDDVAKAVLDEKHAVDKARDIVVHALMRPIHPKVKVAPHEPVTVQYFQHMCAKHSSFKTSSALMFFGRKSKYGVQSFRFSVGNNRSSTRVKHEIILCCLMSFSFLFIY